MAIEPLPSGGCGHTNFGYKCTVCAAPGDRGLRRQPLPSHGRPPVPGECRHKQFPPSRCAVCTAPDDPDYATTRPPDDQRFDWVQIGTYDDPYQWLKARCNHLTPAPVDLRTGELVAWWCPDCGRQLDRDRWPVPDGMWVPLPDVIRPVSGLAHDVTVLPPNGFEQCEKRVGADALIDRAHIDNVPVVLPDGSTYTPLWQNPRMTDSGDMIPWTTWARGALLAPAWDLAKNMIVIMASTSPFLVPLLYIVGSMIGWW